MVRMAKIKAETKKHSGPDQSDSLNRCGRRPLVRSFSADVAGATAGCCVSPFLFPVRLWSPAGQCCSRRNFADPRQITENKKFLACCMLSYVWLLSKSKSFIGLTGEILLRISVHS